MEHTDMAVPSHTGDGSRDQGGPDRDQGAVRRSLHRALYCRGEGSGGEGRSGNYHELWVLGHGAEGVSTYGITDSLAREFLASTIISYHIRTITVL